ncbi:MAG: radical SAM protein, partial [Lachnospiraceae bacterium]|nr:radical SAM protein [Lachnospiraceae bacterium]
GIGVTTLLAFYGCTLNCAYCIINECLEKGNSFSDSLVRASYSPEELITVLKKDEIYYLMSGGGIVFGGGEPLLQSNYIHEVCRLANPKWNIRVETSLNVPWENIEALIGDIDEWIIDIKDMNEDIYKMYTGKPITRMKKNLLKLKEFVPIKKLHIRIPRIEGYNSEEDIQYSANWILENIGVKAEIFSYLVLPHTANKR